MPYPVQKMLPLLLLALAIAVPAAAQSGPPLMWNGRASQRAITDLLFNNPSGHAGQGARAGRAPATSATLPFRRDPAIARQAETMTVQQVRATNAPAAEQLAQLFASKNVLAAWGQAMQPYHLSLNNVADALTANWLVLYLVANELAAPPTTAQVAGLGRQLRRVCALPGIGGKLHTSAQRQQLADYLHLQSLLLNEAQSGAEQTHDSATSAALAQQAREVAKHNMGFDPTTVKLTNNGLVKK